MERVLEFQAGEEKKFALFVNMFIVGGNLKHFNPSQGATSRSRDDRAKEAKIVRGYKAISFETEEGGRKLNKEGGKIVLEQLVFELLTKYVELAPQPTERADEVDDLLNWIHSAAKVEESSKG